MKLQTSYFNCTVLKKNLSRFAPVWVLYSIFWLIILSTNLVQKNYITNLGNWLDLSSFMGAFNMLYAGLCALVLFSDLWNTRICNALHAMPMRREGWLLTHSVSALLFALIPYVIAFSYTLALLPTHWDLALIWLGISLVQFIFFFGLAAFCSLCAGSRLGMAIVYCLFNFLFLLVLGIYELLYQPLLYGIVLNVELIHPLIPVVQMSQPFLEWQNYVPYIVMENIHYILLCGMFGIIFWVFSLLLYRGRKLETAGDLIAFAPMAPVFLICYTLSCGALLYLFTDLTGTNSQYVFFAIGISIGFFTGKMLLNRNIRIFSGKAFLGFGILAAVLVGSVFLTKLDPVGITQRIPQAAEITGVRIYTDQDRYLVDDDWAMELYWLTEAEDISQVTQFHKEMIDRGQEIPREGNLLQLNVEYKLSTGKIFHRYYRVYGDTDLGRELETYLSDWRYVLFTTDLEAYKKSITRIELSSYSETAPAIFKGGSDITLGLEHLPGLMEAIKTDCEAGVLAQDWAFNEGDGWISLGSSLDVETDSQFTGNRDVTIHFGTDCKNIIAFLDSIA